MVQYHIFPSSYQSYLLGPLHALAMDQAILLTFQNNVFWMNDGHIGHLA